MDCLTLVLLNVQHERLHNVALDLHLLQTSFALFEEANHVFHRRKLDDAYCS